MPLTFPYSVATFADVIRMSTVRFQLVADQQVSGKGRGKIIVADMGPKYWQADVTLINMEHSVARQVQALIEALDEGMNDFYLYDPRWAYPAADPDGTKLAAGSQIPIGGEASSGDVPNGVYKAEGVPVPLSSLVSVSGDAGTYFDADGVLRTAGANEVRVDYGPFPNYIPNFKAAGAVAGTPGAPPTGWGVGNDGGLSRSIVGFGVENGISYVDVRFFGTANANSNWYIVPAPAPTIRAIQGQQWSTAMFVQLVSGALPGAIQIGINEYDAANAFLTGGATTFGSGSTFSRQSHTRTLSHASTYSAVPFVQGYFTNGQAVDFTIRIGAPIANRGAAPLEYPRKPLGVMSEASFSNLLLRSEELDNAVWTKTRATIGANSLAAPDGTISADKIIDTTDASNTHQIGQNYANFVSGQNFILSGFGRAAELRFLHVAFNGAAFSTVQRASFDLVNGTSTIVQGTPAVLMEDCGGGWWFVSIAAQATANGGAACVVYLADDTNNVAFTGTGSSGIHAWGFQLTGTGVRRSYLKTTTAIVGRAGDQLTFKSKGTNDVVLTFDDGSTQAFASVPGNFAPAASALNRSRVKRWSATRKVQPAASTVQIASLNVNNKELTLKGLPAGYVLSVGDMLHFDFGSPSMRALHRIVVGGIADGSGVSPSLEVRPHIEPGAAVDAIVTLIKPSARMKIIPDSFDPGTARQMMTSGMGFKCRQVL